MERFIRKIDICAVPSRSEDPLPTVAIEAGMAGLPCVATKQGGLPEIIEDKKSGFLVDGRPRSTRRWRWRS